MNVLQTFVCFFFLTLREGNTALINTDIGVRTGTEGGNITVGCSFTFSGSRMMFCRNDCADGDVLVGTTGVRVQRGRYSIELKDEPSYVLYVSIRNLRKSDSGQYKCEMVRDYGPDSSEKFELRVEDVTTTSNPKSTPHPLSTSTPSTSSVTTTKSPRQSSTTGSSSPSSASTESNKPQQQTPSPGPLTYLALLLVLMILILSLALLIFCWRRARKPKGLPSKTEYADVHQANRVYEEINEEKRQATSSATVYAKINKPGTEASNIYSLANDPANQNQTKDDPDTVAYSMVDFSNRPSTSRNSAPPGENDKVIYSVPRARAGLEDDPAALYSNVTLN